MNVKLFVIASAIIFFELNLINANPTYLVQEPTATISEDGGIRTIVLGLTSIEIYQEIPTLLFVKIYNNIGDLVQIEQTTALSLSISTEGWSTGVYRIVTLAEGEHLSQDFEINIP